MCEFVHLEPREPFYAPASSVEAWETIGHVAPIKTPEQIQALKDKAAEQVGRLCAAMALWA